MKIKLKINSQIRNKFLWKLWEQILKSLIKKWKYKIKKKKIGI
jgi:hypothetical protein